MDQKFFEQPLYYKIDGTPYTGTQEEQVLAWGRDFANRFHNGGIIAQDTLPNGIYISTVWDGLDHSFGTGPPLIFESMAFGPGKPLDRRELDQERYSTKAEAEEGHRKMVNKFNK